MGLYDFYMQVTVNYGKGCKALFDYHIQEMIFKYNFSGRYECKSFNKLQLFYKDVLAAFKKSECISHDCLCVAVGMRAAKQYGSKASGWPSCRAMGSRTSRTETCSLARAPSSDCR